MSVFSRVFTSIKERYNRRFHPLSKADYRLLEAAQWVDSLDRSALGVFASDRESLIAVAASTEQKYAGGEYDRETAADLGKHMQSVLFQHREQRHAYEMTVQAELYFWWLHDDVKSHIEIVNELLPVSAWLPRMRKFHLLYDNPQMYRFFEADIWDVTFIQQCLDNDIDFEIALTLHTTT